MYRAQADFMEPMVYIAHEMTPFSPEDVTVLSNCPRVRLRTFVGDSVREQPREGRWLSFEKAYDFMAHKALARSGRHAESYLLAEVQVNRRTTNTVIRASPECQRPRTA